MFEIIGKDISELNDSDLRVLVERLCEAELGRTMPKSNPWRTWGSITSAAYQNSGFFSPAASAITTENGTFVVLLFNAAS